jgi:hypothetical protein
VNHAARWASPTGLDPPWRVWSLHGLSRFTQRLGNVGRWRVGRRRAVLPRREAPDVPLCAVDVGRERSMLRSAGVLPYTSAALHSRKFVALARVILLPTGSA